jgi:hypothetical protein
MVTAATIGFTYPSIASGTVSALYNKAKQKFSFTNLVDLMLTLNDSTIGISFGP